VIAVFYTGDVRHNQDIAQANHKLLIDRLSELAPVNVYRFTRDDPDRGSCPYDPLPDIPDPDVVYRRGQGGAVQVWDFMRGVQRTQEPIVVRLRTDLWFTASSLDTIVTEVQALIDNEYGIAYFGSDWINDTIGAENLKLNVDINYDPHVQDFVVAARRDSLKSFEDVITHLDAVNPNKRRSGNKTFRYIIPDQLVGKNVREQTVKTYRILCQLYLIRQDYSDYPDDTLVCRDYIQSYIVDDKAKLGKKNLISPHPMQDAVNWWRQQQGWEPKDIQIKQWWDWQTL
jgi:hypothetical protein